MLKKMEISKFRKDRFFIFHKKPNVKKDANIKISTFHFKNCSNVETQLNIFLIHGIKNLLDLKIPLQGSDVSVQLMHLRDEIVLVFTSSSTGLVL